VKGARNRICPQALPDWVLDKAPLSLPDQDEDCLFLDVYVTMDTWTQAQKKGPNGPKAPVYVWFHDGK